MKFGKKVLYELQQFPVDVQQHCLDYRHWKKRAHEPRLITAVSWKLRLARECSRIDRFLNERKGAMDQETLDRIAVLNTDILYKVCKRLEKRTGVPSMKHLSRVMKQHQYAFTRCSFDTLLAPEVIPCSYRTGGSFTNGES